MAIAGVAAAVRLYRLDHFSYGLDEVLQGFWIQGTWQSFWNSLRFDAVHPPLDYLIARGVEAFGPTDSTRKLLDVLWGSLTVLVFGALIARRGGRVAGLLAAILLAFAPFHVRYSQEFRPYSLGLLLLCLSLLCLERFLDRPDIAGLAALYLTCLATAYALYLAAFVLGFAALAMLVEDSSAPDLSRRRTARRLLAWSPLFAGALFLAYLPWWPVVVEASRRPPMAPRAVETFARAERILSFFLFAPDGDHPLKASGVFYLLMALGGGWLAARQRGLRFLLAWSFGGLAAIETLGQLHPHYDFARRFLPAGIAIPGLAAVFLAAFMRLASIRWIAAALVAAILALDARGLASYFRDGRADWRPLARFLRDRPKTERIFTENQYSELCVAFYVEGPQWLYRGGRMGRDIWNLDGEVVRLTWSWAPGSTAWLVLAGEPEHPTLRTWAERLQRMRFPTAEGAVLVKLDPALRESVLAH